MAFRKGYLRKLGIIVLVVVVVATGLVFLHYRKPGRQSPLPSTQQNRSATAAARTGGGPSPASDSSGEEPVPESGAASDRALEKATQSQVEQTDRLVATDTGAEINKELWTIEDAVLAKMPRYSDVKADYLKKAQDLLQAAKAQTTDDIVSLAQKLGDEFWSAGSLSEPAAYEHAFLARAVLETALDAAPDNYQLLTALRHAISLTAPCFRADYTRNDDAYDALWPIVDKQKQMVLSGRVPVSIDAMLAMYDWVEMATTLKKDIAERTAVWKWLVDSADSGGWASMRGDFAQGLKLSRAGGGLGMVLYSMNDKAGTFRERCLLGAHHVRLLPSHPGSPAFRKASLGVWEQPASTGTSHTVFYDPAAKKEVEAPLGQK